MDRRSVLTRNTSLVFGLWPVNDWVRGLNAGPKVQMKDNEHVKRKLLSKM